MASWWRQDVGTDSRAGPRPAVVFDGTLHGLCLELFFSFFSSLFYPVTDGSNGAYILVVVLLISLEASIERPDVDDMKTMQISRNIKNMQSSIGNCGIQFCFEWLMTGHVCR